MTDEIPDETTARARRQIHDALRWYCRGIDRLDPAAVLRGFHPGAELVDYGPQPLTIEQFVEHALASLGAKYAATQHRISNTLIEFDGGSARSGAATVETYVLAFHVRTGNDGAPDELHAFNGRYVDHFSESADGWRIARRTLRNDWSSVEPITARMAGSWPTSGRGGSPDPLDG